MSIWFILVLCAAYGAFLFAAAWQAERPSMQAWMARHSSVLFSLSLTVYCTSWTYFGAVGTAVRDGWSFLPIYLGPALVFLLAPDFLRRLHAISKRQNITSLSDFVAARYGKSRLLAATATLIAAAGALPYIALQLQSVSQSVAALRGWGSAGAAVPGGPGTAAVFVTAAALAMFAILFGARSTDASRANPGLILALAVEAVVKLGALIAVCILALVMSAGAPDRAEATFGERFSAGGGAGGYFLTLTLLAMAAIVALPRQFHVTITEAPAGEAGVRALRFARWSFPLYLALTSLVVPPIALAGLKLLPASVSPDLYVLALPEAAGQGWLGAVAFLGGLSAATGMVVVAAIALSTMIANDLIVPAMMRLGWAGERGGVGGTLLLAIRRGVIAALMLAAFVFWRWSGGASALAQMGLLAFAAAAQFGPALIGGVYWRGGHRNGAVAGLAVGGLLWFYTLIAPVLLGPEALAGSVMATALGGALHPQALLGIGGLDPLTHGALWSVGANLTVYVLVSLRARQRLVDRVQAAAFTRGPDAPDPDRPRPMPPRQQAGVRVADLKTLAARFLAPEAVDLAFVRFGAELGQSLRDPAQADWPLVQKTERLLAGALGASTARIVMGSALAQADVPLEDMLRVLDETSDERRFKRHLLQSTLENITQGVSVIDKDLKLVAWNGVYLELFDYPPDLIRVGTPIEDVIRYNAERGDIGPGDVEEQVARRLAHMRSGSPHVYERRRRDGRILRMVGNPMPGGGYVTTFTDVTAERLAEQALREAKETLEERVAERTADLERVAAERDLARRAAESADAIKTRFLAAASHDLQQPLNAARLFAAALGDQLGDDAPVQKRLAGQIDRSIRAADRMLRGLLDLSRFEGGGIEPRIERVPLAPLFDELEHEHAPVARGAGLRLVVRPPALAVRGDKALLRSILQNLLSNALRYTTSGGVLVAARSRDGGKAVSLEVWDTGPGVPAEARERIFQEFRRLHETDTSGERGAGLGLAIAARAAALMDASVDLRSEVGRGSVFRVTLPACDALGPAAAGAAVSPPSAPAGRRVEGLKVLCIDDEPGVLDAMGALLTAWGVSATLVDGVEGAMGAARTLGPFDAVLADYHLGDGRTGADALRALAAEGLRPGAAALLTADLSDEVRAHAADLQAGLIPKPVDPGALFDMLAGAQDGS